MINQDNEKFREHVRKSLIRQVEAINKLVQKGLRFWDYGNSFMLESSRAGADIWEVKGEKFRFPSYFENVMDDIFGLGFGPFRWVCTSGDPLDLRKTDEIAINVFKSLGKEVPAELQSNYADNLRWIQNAEENKLVVGSQARILYADCEARVEISL
jgi:urocanate hydratase